MKNNKFDLEDRLIDFSVLLIKLIDEIPRVGVGYYLSNQLMRSGTSLALNYGEALAAESRRDFIHKMKISLKEMRESFVCLKIIKRASLLKSKNLETSLIENNELISIFVKSIETAKTNQNKRIRNNRS